MSEQLPPPVAVLHARRERLLESLAQKLRQVADMGIMPPVALASALPAVFAALEAHKAYGEQLESETSRLLAQDDELSALSGVEPTLRRELSRRSMPVSISLHANHDVRRVDVVDDEQQTDTLSPGEGSFTSTPGDVLVHALALRPRRKSDSSIVASVLSPSPGQRAEGAFAGSVSLGRHVKSSHAQPTDGRDSRPDSDEPVFAVKNASPPQFDIVSASAGDADGCDADRRPELQTAARKHHRLPSPVESEMAYLVPAGKVESPPSIHSPALTFPFNLKTASVASVSLEDMAAAAGDAAAELLSRVSTDEVPSSADLVSNVLHAVSTEQNEVFPPSRVTYTSRHDGLVDDGAGERLRSFDLVSRRPPSTSFSINHARMESEAPVSDAYGIQHTKNTGESVAVADAAATDTDGVGATREKWSAPSVGFAVMTTSNDSSTTGACEVDTDHSAIKMRSEASLPIANSSGGRAAAAVHDIDAAVNDVKKSGRHSGSIGRRRTLVNSDDAAEHRTGKRRGGAVHVAANQSLSTHLGTPPPSSSLMAETVSSASAKADRRRRSSASTSGADVLQTHLQDRGWSLSRHTRARGGRRQQEHEQPRPIWRSAMLPPKYAERWRSNCTGVDTAFRMHSHVPSEGASDHGVATTLQVFVDRRNRTTSGRRGSVRGERLIDAAATPGTWLHPTAVPPLMSSVVAATRAANVPSRDGDDLPHVEGSELRGVRFNTPHLNCADAAVQTAIVVGRDEVSAERDAEDALHGARTGRRSRTPLRSPWYPAGMRSLQLLRSTDLRGHSQGRGGRSASAGKTSRGLGSPARQRARSFDADAFRTRSLLHPHTTAADRYLATAEPRPRDARGGAHPAGGLLEQHSTVHADPDTCLVDRVSVDDHQVVGADTNAVVGWAPRGGWSSASYVYPQPCKSTASAVLTPALLKLKRRVGEARSVGYGSDGAVVMAHESLPRAAPSRDPRSVRDEELIAAVDRSSDPSLYGNVDVSGGVGVGATMFRSPSFARRVMQPSPPPVAESVLNQSSAVLDASTRLALEHSSGNVDHGRSYASTSILLRDRDAIVDALARSAASARGLRIDRSGVHDR